MQPRLVIAHSIAHMRAFAAHPHTPFVSFDELRAGQPPAGRCTSNNLFKSQALGKKPFATPYTVSSDLLNLSCPNGAERMCDNTMDPDGDVILKLEYPNDPFALDSDSALSKYERPSSILFSPQNAKEELGEADKTEPITFRVSSRHLALASPVFKSALTGGWKESIKTEGEFQIDSQGWDTTALTIFLNTIHCQYRQVPRSLELEMLAKVAVIVDYYAAHQAMEILSSAWVDNLRWQLPTTTCENRKIALWICISWVFDDSIAFETATKVAIHHGRSKLTNFGLPIPDKVLGKMSHCPR